METKYNDKELVYYSKKYSLDNKQDENNYKPLRIGVICNYYQDFNNFILENFPYINSKNKKEKFYLNDSFSAILHETHCVGIRFDIIFETPEAVLNEKYNNIKFMLEAHLNK